MHGLETIVALNAAAVTAHGVCAAIWDKAAEAAQKAAEIYDATLPRENARGFDCGFAWVIIRPARGVFVDWCKRHGKGWTITHSGGGFIIWYSKVHNIPTQSIGVHSVACSAFAEVLKAHSINAHTEQRLD